VMARTAVQCLPRFPRRETQPDTLTPSAPDEVADELGTLTRRFSAFEIVEVMFRHGASWAPLSSNAEATELLSVGLSSSTARGEPGRGEGTLCQV